jgi:hypothetical protein
MDLPPEVRSKKRMAAPLVIIPGPKEPSNIEPYISGVLQEFAAYGPTTGTQSHIVVEKAINSLITPNAF